jgi:hypothetical protein
MGAGGLLTGRRRGWALMCAVVLVASAGFAAATRSASAEVIRGHNDSFATGWYPTQDKLASQVVVGGTFGQLFSTPVTGSIYAQPLVDDDSGTKTLLAETEDDYAYGLDPVTGAQRWVTPLDPPSASSPQPWHAADLGCADLSPNVGVTGTPVIDDTTHTEYFTAKEYDPSGPSGVIYEMYALDTVTGAIRPGFPMTIAGEANNEQPGVHIPFDAKYELQRPGLLLMDGVVYAAFAGHCDHPPYWGFVVGVNATTGAQTTLWAAQGDGHWGAGIWQAGGSLVSDRDGSILLASGNGFDDLTAPTPGNTPSADIDESVVRLNVQPNGSLKPVDFFMPDNAPTLDVNDQDFGSGGPVALPTSYNGTPLFSANSTHPDLMVEVGKAGYMYLLDRDNLGGYRMGPNGNDAVPQVLGPTGPVWSTPTVWPGDGGYVYIVHDHGANGERTGYMRAYKYGTDAHNNPLLNFVGQTTDGFGFGSGTPVVTSNGLQSGSALVWVIWQADGGGRNAELRAYDAVPVNGVLQQRWSAPIGQATKFEAPAVEDNRVYVGTRDGHVLGFGSPVDQPFTASPDHVGFGTSIVGHSSTQTLTFTANDNNTTVNTISSNDGDFRLGAPSHALPVVLNQGEALSIPVTFNPDVPGATGGSIDLQYSANGVPAQHYVVSAEGVGQSATGDLNAFPENLSMGGTPIGHPTSTTLTLSNLGAQTLTITSGTFPKPPFHTTGLPIGTKIAPGASVSATVTFSASTAGQFNDVITVHSDAVAPGNATITVPVSASAAGPAHLVITPANTYFGTVRVGSTALRNVKLTNTGQSTMQITKSKPPVSGVGFASAGLPLDEADTIAPGRSAVITIGFTPKSVGHFTDQWIINGDDDSGVHTLTFDGYGGNPAASYWMTDTSGRIYPLGTAQGASGPRFTSGTKAIAIDPTPTGQGYYVVDNFGQVQTFGNAVNRGSVIFGGLKPGEHIASMSLTPSGNGYWIFSSLGRVFPFGDAGDFGDMSGVHLNGSIIASIATPSGAGYYMVGSDGGVFTFGDANFYGSTGGMRLNQPVVGIVPTTTGLGYYLAAADGGVFTFGDAKFRGSMGGQRLNKPVVGIVRYGNGYLMVASDGGIFDFSNSAFVGSLANNHLPQPIVAVGAFAV